MDIVEILVLTLSIPGMCLVLLILTCVEEWLGEDTEDGWAFRPADAQEAATVAGAHHHIAYQEYLP